MTSGYSQTCDSCGCPIPRRTWRTSCCDQVVCVRRTRPRRCPALSCNLNSVKSINHTVTEQATLYQRWRTSVVVTPFKDTDLVANRQLQCDFLLATLTCTLFCTVSKLCRG